MAEEYVIYMDNTAPGFTGPFVGVKKAGYPRLVACALEKAQRFSSSGAAGPTLERVLPNWGPRVVTLREATRLAVVAEIKKGRGD